MMNMKWLMPIVVYLCMITGLRAMELVKPEVCQATVQDFFAKNKSKITRFNKAFATIMRITMDKINAVEQCRDDVSAPLARRIATGGLSMAECGLTEDTGFFPFLRLWHTFTQIVSYHVQNRVYLTNVKCFCRTALEEIEHIATKAA